MHSFIIFEHEHEHEHESINSNLTEDNSGRVGYVLQFLALEMAFAAACLCLFLRGETFPARTSLRVPQWGTGLIIFLNFALICRVWGLFDPVLASPPIKTLLTLMVFLLNFAWYFYSQKIIPYRDGGGSRTRVETAWLAIAGIGQLSFTLYYALLFASSLSQNLPVYPYSTGLLALSLSLGLATGGFLVAAVLFGVIVGFATPITHGSSERLARAAGRLEFAITLRILAVTCSLALGAFFHPFGPRYFFLRLLTGDFLLPFTRVLLGLILPALFGWLALLSLEDGQERQAAQQFFPSLLVIVLGEILAAGLTVGNFGLAL